MKREKIRTFFKEKGFLLAVATGILAFFAIAIISVNINSIDRQLKSTPDNTPNLSESTLPEIASNQQSSVQEENFSPVELESSYGASAPDTSASEIASIEADITFPVESDAVIAEEVLESETQAVTSISQEQLHLQNLDFDEEAGLLWPVSGDILMNYNMEQLVYFNTLAQYRCNPAVIIASSPGTEVFAAASGVVTSIEELSETGITLSMNIGKDYQLVYGQLDSPTVAVGDMVLEGDVLGYIAEPTNYYSLEGPNLYFQVLQNNESVDPMLVLR